MTLLLAGDDLAVIGSANLPRHLFAPGARLVLDIRSRLGVSRVALGLEPGLTNDLGFSVGGIPVAHLLHGSVTLLHRVIVRHLSEVNFARLPEALFAFLLLTGQELGDVRIVTLSYVLVPALFNLVLDLMLHIFGLGDAPRSSGSWNGIGEVDDP